MAEHTRCGLLNLTVNETHFQYSKPLLPISSDKSCHQQAGNHRRQLPLFHTPGANASRFATQPTNNTFCVRTFTSPYLDLPPSIHPPLPLPRYTTAIMKLVRYALRSCDGGLGSPMGFGSKTSLSPFPPPNSGNGNGADWTSCGIAS